MAWCGDRWVLDKYRMAVGCKSAWRYVWLWQPKTLRDIVNINGK